MTQHWSLSNGSRLSRSAIGALLLAAGFEGVFASGGAPVFRVVIIAGVVLLGWPRLSWREFWARCVVSLIVALYVVAASARYPGLAKEPWPLHWTAQARLFAVFFSVVLAGTLVISAVRAAIARVQTR